MKSIRLLDRRGSINAGETCGVPDEEAVALVRAHLAEPVGWVAAAPVVAESASIPETPPGPGAEQSVKAPAAPPKDKMVHKPGRKK
jgi:hypothetical protein